MLFEGLYILLHFSLIKFEGLSIISTIRVVKTIHNLHSQKLQITNNNIIINFYTKKWLFQILSKKYPEKLTLNVIKHRHTLSKEQSLVVVFILFKNLSYLFGHRCRLGGVVSVKVVVMATLYSMAYLEDVQVSSKICSDNYS